MATMNDANHKIASEYIEQQRDMASSRQSGTIHDVQDMSRLGKKQEFMRNFRFYSILGFTSTLMATWEAILA